MWNFKPDEKNDFSKNVIFNNQKFIPNHKTIGPKDIESLLKLDTFPDLLELYNLIPNWVIKADLGRLLYIYYYGGLYCDIDCFITKSFPEVSSNIILFIEHIVDIRLLGDRECKNPDNKVRIANFLFGSKITHHHFLKECIEECIKRMKQLFLLEKKKKLSHTDILWVCGPDVITTIYHKQKSNYNDLSLYNNQFFSHKSFGSWR